MRPLAADTRGERRSRSFFLLRQPAHRQQRLSKGHTGLRLCAAGGLPAAAALPVQAAARLCGRRTGHLAGHGEQRYGPSSSGGAARRAHAPHGRNDRTPLPGDPALGRRAALRHAAGSDHGPQRDAFAAIIHRPQATVPMDADGDARRPPACKGPSDGGRASPYRLLFHRELRAALLRELDGVSSATSRCSAASISPFISVKCAAVWCGSCASRETSRRRPRSSRRRAAP